MNLTVSVRNSRVGSGNLNPSAKTQGPFTLTYVWADERKTTRVGMTWRGLKVIGPMVGRLADRDRVHSIDVLDRHGVSCVFASDVLPLFESGTR